MGRINGIGTAHLSVEPREPDGTRWATLWFTFFFLPIVPIRRERLELFAHQGTGYACRIHERGPMRIARVVRTVLFAWLLVPLAVLAPVPLLITEVAVARLGLSETVQNVAIGVWIVWLIAWAWGLAEWHERRLRPAGA